MVAMLTSVEYFPAREIRAPGVRGLWIGSKGDSMDISFMRRHDVGLVVNCSRNIPSRFAKYVRYERVAVDDAPHDPIEQSTMLSRLPVIVRAIDAALRAGEGVLVHCHAGMQRSAAVVAAYLMWKLRLSAAAAMRVVKAQKRETFEPRPSFTSALAQWEADLNPRASSPPRSTL